MPSSNDTPPSPAGALPPAELRVEVTQFRPRKAEVSGNLALMAEWIARAAGQVDLLVFPETATSGYFVEGGVEEVARSTEEIARGLGPAPAGAPDVVLGAYERSPDGVLHNAALHLTPDVATGEGRGGWRLVHLHRKVFLPTYGLFDEARFVKPGLDFEAYDTRFGRMGLLVCEEMLHSLPPTILALDGAEFLVALSASPAREYRPGPGHPASLERWHVAARAITLEHGVHLGLAHLVGSEGGRIFAGGSAVYGPGGRVLQAAPLFREAGVRVAVPLALGRIARVRSPMLEDLRAFLPHVGRALERAGRRRSPAWPTPREGGTADSRAPESVGDPLRSAGSHPHPRVDPHDTGVLRIDPELVEAALLTFLRDEVEGRRGFRDVVVGVSGGVDSAVTLALAVRAFGVERVHAFLLPYATSSPESLEHGRLVCRTFGVEAREIPISASVDAYIDAEEPELSPRRRGNLAARFRAMVLWDQSARVEGLVLGTGNKSERLMGYFTWHADDSPPVNPLGDLFKTQVRALGVHLGVPAVVLEKPPSADLVRGVHDEDELGVPYARADLVLHWLLEGMTPEALEASGFDGAEVRRVHALLSGTHWKRRPPATALLSGSGIGDFYLRPVDF